LRGGIIVRRLSSWRRESLGLERYHVRHCRPDRLAVIAGQELEGWMRKEAAVHIRQADAGRNVTMKIEVPSWMPISFPAAITIRVSESKISQFIIPKPGNYSLSVPLE
jgi:hypothetical protein